MYISTFALQGGQFGGTVADASTEMDRGWLETFAAASSGKILTAGFGDTGPNEPVANPSAFAVDGALIFPA